jgi:hypothetical protein
MKNIIKVGSIFLLVLMVAAALIALEFAAEAQAADDITVTIDTGESITLKDTDGDGYYEIGNADELYAFSAAVNGDYPNINVELAADITVNENVLTDDGELNGDGSEFRQWITAGGGEIGAWVTFGGNFEGNGKTISGLYYSGNKMIVSFIGNIGTATKVSNLSIVDSYYYTSFSDGGMNRVGGIVGYTGEDAIIEKCSFQGVIKAPDSGCVGGICGDLETSRIFNCHVIADIEGCQKVGGIAGYMQESTIENCYYMGEVKGESKVGGAVGVVYFTSAIKSCYAIAEVIGNEEVDAFIGKKHGYSDIYNCYILDTFGTSTHATAISEEHFESGEITYMLQNGTAITASWGQKLGEGGDKFPVLGGEKVYKNQIGGCTYDSAVYAYSNTSQDAIYTHADPEEGDHLCSRGCGTVVDGGCYDTVADGKCDKCGSDLAVIDGVTYKVLGDVTNTGLSSYDEPGCYRAGDGYIVWTLGSGSEPNKLILYNATIDLRNVQEANGVTVSSTGLADYDVIFYGYNYLYAKEGEVGMYFLQEYGLSQRFIGKGDDALLNVFGGVFGNFITFDGGRVNLFGNGFNSPLDCESLRVEKNTVVNAASAGKILGFWSEIIIRESSEIEGTLNGILTTFEGKTMVFTALGEALIGQDYVVDISAEVLAEVGVERFKLVVPEWTKLVVPAEFTLDLDSFDEVVIKGEIVVQGKLICDHEGGEASCSSGAVCDTCKTVYTDPIMHTPVADDGDCTTAIICSLCKNVVIAAKEAHTDADTDGKCDECAKVMATTSESDSDTQPKPEQTAEGVGSTEESDGITAGAVVAIVISALIGIGAVCVIVWFVVKKKR